MYYIHFDMELLVEMDDVVWLCYTIYFKGRAITTNEMVVLLETTNSCPRIYLRILCEFHTQIIVRKR